MQLLRWVLGKVKQRGGEVDSNKQYTSELLAILMQHSEKNQTRLGDMNGMDTVLQAIAYYKNRHILAEINMGICVWQTAA